MVGQRRRAYPPKIRIRKPRRLACASAAIGWKLLTAEKPRSSNPGRICFLATGEDARRVHGDLAELHALRLKRAGGYVLKRGRSPYWQIKYLVDGKWRHESSHTRIKHDAKALLTEKVFYASAGTLPGTASFEQIIDALVADARVRKFGRLAEAARSRKARLAGHRAEDCNYAVWLKYADERQQEAAIDTVHLELGVAKRAYKLAHASGVVSRIPDFPRIGNLRVRQGFVDPAQWSQLRTKLRSDFRDAADFAFLCGPREMEVLTLQWSDIERGPRVIHFRETKTGRPRTASYAEYEQLAEVIERRAAVHEQLKRADVITPSVFLLQCAGGSSRPPVSRGRCPAFQNNRTARPAWNVARGVGHRLCGRRTTRLALSRPAPLGRA
jgi:integrase